MTKMDMLSVAGFLVGLLGIYLAWIPLRKRQTFSWRNVLTLVDRLAWHFKKESGELDYIFASQDGGLIVADLLHIRHFPRAKIISIPVQTVKSGNRKSAAKDLILQISTENRQPRILIVDDVIQTGKSIEAIRDLVSDVLPEAIISVGALAKLTTLEGHEHYHAEVEYRSGVSMPWGNTPR